MTNLQTDLIRIEQEFKSAFPDTNLASLIDKQKREQVDRFLYLKYGALISTNKDSLHYSELGDGTSRIDNLNPELANNAPILYAVDKAICYISAVSYYKFSDDGYRKIVDSEISGILGSDEPISKYVAFGDYLNGKRLKISDKSTETEWQNYLINSSAACAKEYPFASLFDADIEQFKTEIHSKILASLVNPVQTEL